MNRTLYFVIGALAATLILSYGIANAASVFTSGQVGTSAANNFVLQTNGTNSTWVSTSTAIGIVGIANGGTGTSTFTTGSRLVVSHGTAPFSDIALPLTVSNGGTGTATLTGLVKGNGTGTMTVGVNGTDYTLIAANSCAGGNHFATVTAAGVFTCTADSGGGGGGSGTVGTSSAETLGYFPMWGTTNGSPALLTGTSNLFQFANNIGIGTTTAGFPLTIVAPTGSSTALTALGNVNGFLQGNIQNLSNAASASSDWVATADNGDDANHYIDFGINGSGGGVAPFTGANQSYLYSATDPLNIGALGTTSYITLSTTGGASAVERARITSAGNLGIGLIAPTAKLEVVGTSTTDGDKSLLVWDSSLNSLLSVGNNRKVGINVLNPVAILGVQGTSTSASDALLNLKNGNGTAVFNVNSDGDTSIYSTSTQALNVQGGTATNAGFPTFNVDTTGAGGNSGLFIVNGSSNVNLTASSSAATAGLTFATKGNANITMQANGATKLQFANSGNAYTNGTHTFTFVAGNSTSAHFVITAAADGSISAGLEAPFIDINQSTSRSHASNTLIPLQRDTRIRNGTHSFITAGGVISQAAAVAIDGPDTGGANTTITNSTGLMIGTTSATSLANTTNGFGLQIFGPTGATNNYAASTTGKIVHNGLTTSAATQGSAICGTNADGGELIAESVSCLASAFRYKTDIATTTFSLDGLMQLQPISFDWKKSFLKGNTDPNQTGTQYSLVADDVQKVFPQLVAVTSATTTFEDKQYAPGSVQGLADVNHWVSAIVSWLQQIVHRQDDQQKQIDELKAQITAQQAQIDALTHKK